MRYPIYSIRDALVGFNQPMTDINDMTASRNFAQAINNNQTFSFSPKDYDLYKLGEVDTETGALISEPVPVLIVTGASVFGSDVR